MPVTVEYAAQIKRVAGVAHDIIELAEPCTVLFIQRFNLSELRFTISSRFRAGGAYRIRLAGPRRKGDHVVVGSMRYRLAALHHHRFTRPGLTSWQATSASLSISR